MNIKCPICNAELNNELPVANFTAKRLDCSNCGVFLVSNNLYLENDLTETSKIHIKTILNNKKDKLEDLRKQGIYPYFLSARRDWDMVQEAKIQNEMINSKYYFFILK